jgi:antitoxin HicB
MKNLDYFMALPYRMELEPIPAEQGGGFSASIPLLGRYALCADGNTVEEALDKLEEIKREVFTTCLEEGVVIPEPDPEEDEYSGRFVLRIPKYLHRELALRAKTNNTSLNQFVSCLLSGSLQRDILQSRSESVRDFHPRCGKRRQDAPQKTHSKAKNYAG